MRNDQQFIESLTNMYLDLLSESVDNPTRRIVHITTVKAMDTRTQEPVNRRITLVAEPPAYGSTMYPPRDAPYTTSVVEQLRSFERLEAADGDGERTDNL